MPLYGDDDARWPGCPAGEEIRWRRVRVRVQRIPGCRLRLAGAHRLELRGERDTEESATQDRFAHSSRAKIPVKGPYVLPNAAVMSRVMGYT